MWNDWLAVESAIWIMIGTIVSVLCVLKLSIKNVIHTVTCEGLRNAHLGVLEQRHYARMGISIIVIGTFLQIVSILWKKAGIFEFVLFSMISLLLMLILFVVFNVFYKKDKIKCSE